MSSSVVSNYAEYLNSKKLVILIYSQSARVVGRQGSKVAPVIVIRFLKSESEEEDRKRIERGVRISAGDHY